VLGYWKDLIDRPTADTTAFIDGATAAIRTSASRTYSWPGTIRAPFTWWISGTASGWARPGRASVGFGMDALRRKRNMP
jgi:hypothetical protein